MAERVIGNRYHLQRKVLPGNHRLGVPELWEAQDAGDIYYLKLWRRRKEEHSDIQALWNREVRSLSRLHGYPGAGQLFARLHDLGASEDAYYAVLDGGRRMLLSEALQRRAAHDWLSNLSEVGRRRNLWDGLLRLAEAIVVLHREGTLHRSISTSAVFAGPGGASDFRLSGFEWSLRVAGSEGAAPQVGRTSNYPRAPELDKPEGEYTTATDWYDFGLVAAEIFGAEVQGNKKRNNIRASVERLSTLNSAEKEVIRRLIGEHFDERLYDGDEIVQQIQELVRTHSQTTLRSGRSLILAFRLPPDGDFAKAISAASLGNARSNDPQGLRDWIETDLKNDPRIIARTKPYPHYIVRGNRFQYRIKEWSTSEIKTWDIGYCEGQELTPRTVQDDQIYSVNERSLDVQLYPRVVRNSRTIRDRSISWDRAFPFQSARISLPAELSDIHDFFRITHQLETVIIAAQICPVEVRGVENNATETIVTVTPTEDASRNELAQALKIPRPSQQLRDLFELGVEDVVVDDNDPSTETFQLLEQSTLTGDHMPVSWYFDGASVTPDGPYYRFRFNGNKAINAKQLYVATNHVGTMKQIRRRHRAIEELRSHENLLRFLASPLEATRERQDEVPVGSASIPLDNSKARALEQLWKTEPAFMIQGPPGTGKTTLIKAFVDRALTNDPSAQILISAHSHHTVDDVRIKIAELFSTEDGERPILLRTGARDATEHDVKSVTGEIISKLGSSALCDRSPAHLRARLQNMCDPGLSSNDDVNSDQQAMQILCKDAANVTFTTLNSADLADISERGRRFDWSIIEEAGKAHGFDMALAIQASHRLLLIGDHFQLPPFNARVFRDLLGDPLRVRDAIKHGAEFARGLVDASIVEDNDDRDPFVDRCAKWRDMVTVFANLFQSADANNSLGRSATATLTDQHRMHPDIAELVGRTFYRREQQEPLLTTPAEVVQKFRKRPPYTIVPNSWLPDARIVWCDVPWVQKKEWSEGEVDGLFISPKEVERVVDVLKQFRPKEGEDCTLQILSPYNNQLNAIRTGVADHSNIGELSHMFAPPFDLKHLNRMGATVDEFQGSEADVIVVSLVRNNGLPPAKSIGFLKEPNRMNVLLSRARQKLIIVGSWDFFDTRCNELTMPDDEHNYIGNMMAIMKELKDAKKLAVVRDYL